MKEMTLKRGREELLSGPRSLPSTETNFSRRARHFFRWFRNGPLPIAHPLLRRLIQAVIPWRQIIRLRSGLVMDVDLRSAVQSTVFWYDGDMEPQLSWAVRELLPLGGTFVDCGANCGYIGLEARLRKFAQVMFIEPHPDLARTVEANIELNGWGDSCTVIQAAASDHEGTATLFACEVYDGSHSLLQDWWGREDQLRKVTVSVKTLASLLEGDSRFEMVSFLKVDTEGNDVAVLKGLGALLNPARVAVIYAEMARDRDAGCRLLEEGSYSGFGFRPHRSGKALRKAVRQYGDGTAAALFLPLNRCPGAGETLWVGKGSVEEAHLLDLAERAHKIAR